jgi:hypothetical protein
MIEVTVTASRRSVQNLLRQLSNLSSGSSQLGKALLIRMGLAALANIQRNFALKAVPGGTGEDREQWHPHAPATIRKRMAKAVKGKSGKRRAKAAAAQILILRDTGLLFNSLTPGISTGGHMPDRKAHQVFQLDPGSVTIGTSRVGALYNHEGRLPHLPQRRLWPAPRDWPKAWWSDVLSQGRQGLLEVAQAILSRGP